MAAASGGLVFVYGLGAIFGPFVIGQMMSMIGNHPVGTACRRLPEWAKTRA
jgi:hypothetical protein